MDGLDCNGYEYDIANCMTKQWGSNNCSSNMDVGLRCRKLNFVSGCSSSQIIEYV